MLCGHVEDGKGKGMVLAVERAPELILVIYK